MTEMRDLELKYIDLMMVTKAIVAKYGGKVMIEMSDFEKTLEAELEICLGFRPGTTIIRTVQTERTESSPTPTAF